MKPEELELRYYPDPVLKRRAEPIGTVDDTVRAWARRMFEVMYEHKGIGLAGPQVGLSRRIFVINLEGDPEKPEEERVFINPQVTDPRGKDSYEEGCLSFPGIHLDIERPTEVHVSALNLEGTRFELETDEILARCIQHELDHLDGILFTTRVSMVRRMAVKKDLKELERRYAEARS